MIASLPMYLRPENRQAHERLWQGIAAELLKQDIPAPQTLDHAINHVSSWQRPDLVLGQICNLPYRHHIRNRVTRIAAADYGLPHCPPGHYCSLFVVREDEPEEDPAAYADRRFAYNDIYSQSGFGAPQLWAAEHGFQFRTTLATGGHRASIAALAEGEADIAAIDAQTWAMTSRYDPQPKSLKVIGATATSPGMTFITAGDIDPAPYFTAISTAIDALDTKTAETLGLRGIVRLDDAAYDIPFPPDYQAPPL